ncbi:alpha/beta hydrolase [Flavobacterium sp. N1736]|uniref:alpha/beta hydrolase n=1 Tax=Flavobacterium sp. N1736 TaxID=2986823 RepID=UPI002224AF71|nr:alpha/beta hydrolase [Flavobacterium sp. N1736]
MEHEKKGDLFANAHKYQFDPGISKSFTNFMDSHAPVEKPKGDLQQIKKAGNQLYINMNAHLPLHTHIHRQDFEMKAADDSDIRLRWYSAGKDTVESSAVIFVHGGGRMFGSVELYDRVVADYVHRSGVPFLSVEYGLAPEVYGKAQVEQIYDSILWLKNNASELNVDVNRIAIMGDSGGGGLAAGAAILARDRKIALAKQILIYPMLDYRTTILDENIEPFAFFGYQELGALWQAITGPDPLSDYDLAITSPAVLDNFEGLASTYISVGDLDYFRNENLDYARKLAGAAVPIEFHLHPGAPHGFEIFTPDAPLSARAIADHVRAIRSI